MESFSAIFRTLENSLAFPNSNNCFGEIVCPIIWDIAIIGRAWYLFLSQSKYLRVKTVYSELKKKSIITAIMTFQQNIKKGDPSHIQYYIRIVLIPYQEQNIYFFITFHKCYPTFQVLNKSQCYNWPTSNFQEWGVRWSTSSSESNPLF